MLKQPARANSTLNSWKKIATFLGRGVRTVQRWEREMGLPIHRVCSTEHSSVFAHVNELEGWRDSRWPLTPVAGQPRPEIQDIAEQMVRRLQGLVREFDALVIEQRNKAEALAQDDSTVRGVHDRRKRSDNYDTERT